ncbi:MAG: hypothetical protein AB1758_25210 [Candidatus Eremiobacterota bacterium]
MARLQGPDPGQEACIPKEYPAWMDPVGAARRALGDALEAVGGAAQDAGLEQPGQWLQQTGQQVGGQTPDPECLERQRQLEILRQVQEDAREM